MYINNNFNLKLENDIYKDNEYINNCLNNNKLFQVF